MSDVSLFDQRFGTIAVSEQYVSQEKLDRAWVVQRCIYKSAKVHMSIEKVLKEMGLITQEQIDAVIAMQSECADDQKTDDPVRPVRDVSSCVGQEDGLKLIVSKDKMAAFLTPCSESLKGVAIDSIKQRLSRQGVVQGIIDDQALADYLATDPPPQKPFQVAAGTPPENGKPPKIKYFFETDPLRIGTLQADGTMDWKNRGKIPEVEAGAVLAEKVGGKPGKPGINVFGKEIQPPRVKEPQFKCSKGAVRSEDGRQVLAKAAGTPKIDAGGRIGVLSILSIKGDIGLETGHVNFDGHIEVAGGVCTGYNVSGRGLRTKEIQNATITVAEDLVSDGGIYGSKLKVGGNIKASHLHNCTIEVKGDLVVEKEIFGCHIDVNGRCLIVDGKIISSKIDAKKGIQVRDVGTEAAKPSELTVGIDHQNEREVKNLKDELGELERQKKDLTQSKVELAPKMEALSAEIGKIHEVQEGYRVQKEQFKEKLEGPNAVEDDEEREMLSDLIVELGEQTESVEKKVGALRQQKDGMDAQLNAFNKSLEIIDEQETAIKEKIARLEDALEADPGIAVVKVSGTLFAKTIIAGPHKNITILQDMQCVRITEARSEFGAQQWQMKISPLR